MARLRDSRRTALLPLKLFEQALYLVNRQNIGQALRGFRQRQPCRGVAFGVILGHAKTVKALHHRRPAAHRGSGITLREQMLLIRHDGLARHLRELLDALRGQEITVGFQVGLVGLDGARRAATLYAQVGDVFRRQIDQIVGIDALVH